LIEQMVMLLMGLVLLLGGCLVTSIAFSSEASTSTHITGGVALILLGKLLTLLGTSLGSKGLS
jgi:hypothetical protein